MRNTKIEKAAVAALEDIKARDITVLDTRPLTAMYDSIIVATAESARQTKALARHVRDKVREAGGQVMSIEGEETGEWVLVDCTEMIVHIMLPTTRALYNLEELWTAPMPMKRAKPAAPVAEVAAPVSASRSKAAPMTKTAERRAAKATKAAAAAVVEAPVVKAPAVKKPAAKPVAQVATKAVAKVDPVVEKVAAKAAVKPVTKAPAAKKPAAKAPAVKAAAAKKPAAKPAAKAPAAKSKAPAAKPAPKAPAAKMKPIKRPAAKAKTR